MENSGDNLPEFDHLKSEILAEIKRVKYDDLEDMVYRKEITYDELMDVFYIKFTSAVSVGSTLPPGINEANDITLMLKPLLPDEVKVNITIDDIKQRSILTTNKRIRFTKIFFPNIIRFYSITLRRFR